MSAECNKHGIHLVGFMEDAYCPLCRLASSEKRYQDALIQALEIIDDMDECCGCLEYGGTQINKAKYAGLR